MWLCIIKLYKIHNAQTIYRNIIYIYYYVYYVPLLRPFQTGHVPASGVGSHSALAAAWLKFCCWSAKPNQHWVASVNNKYTILVHANGCEYVVWLYCLIYYINPMSNIDYWVVEQQETLNGWLHIYTTFILSQDCATANPSFFFFYKGLDGFGTSDVKQRVTDD